MRNEFETRKSVSEIGSALPPPNIQVKVDKVSAGNNSIEEQSYQVKTAHRSQQSRWDNQDLGDGLQKIYCKPPKIKKLSPRGPAMKIFQPFPKY